MYTLGAIHRKSLLKQKNGKPDRNKSSISRLLKKIKAQKVLTKRGGL